MKTRKMVAKANCFVGSLFSVRLLGLAGLLLFAAELAAQPWVMGYYVGYQSSQQSPTQIDYSTMTHIMIGAILPQNNGSFNTEFYLGATQGPAWAQDTVQRAHAAGIKAIVMVGGAGDEVILAFRRVSDPTIRTAFVNNLKAIVDQYGFDGVDIDWEPIDTTPGSPTDDRSRLLALSQALRTTMPTKIMTLPVGWDNMNYHPLSSPFYGQVSAYYDRVNLMSYQMIWCGGGWQSWHSSALYGAAPSTPSSIDLSVGTLIDNGVPKAKIGIGIGFYGQVYENIYWSNGAYVHYGPPYITAPRQSTEHAEVRLADNEISNSNLMRYIYEPSARQWDDTAKVPYLSFQSPKLVPVPPAPSWMSPTVRTTYVTYEDEQSIAEKGKYVRDGGLGGTIIWTISQGYLQWKTSGEKDPYMKAIKTAFLGSTPPAGLEVTSPQGAEIWRRGELRDITWTSTGLSGQLSIELMQNDEVIGVIADSVPISPGRFSWTVGRMSDQSWRLGSGLKIRISMEGQTLSIVNLTGFTGAK